MNLPTTLDEFRLFLEAVKLVLNGYSIFRERKGRPNAEMEKQEHTIGKAVEKAEREIEVVGADSQKVAQELEERLQLELGADTKDEIIYRALGIMAFTRPYSVESFRYYELLAEFLESARTFFLVNNVFTLRGEPENGERFLRLRKFGRVLAGLLERSGYFDLIYRHDQDVSNASVGEILAVLRRESEGLEVRVIVKLDKTTHMGERYSEGDRWDFELVAGNEVNRIGFHVQRHPQYQASRDFDIRISLEEFQGLVFAVVADVTDFASELAHEEQNFQDLLSPVLTKILAAIKGQSNGRPASGEDLAVERGTHKSPRSIKRSADISSTPPLPITEKCVECGRDLAGSKTLTLCPYCFGSLCERCAVGHNERLKHPETPEVT